MRRIVLFFLGFACLVLGGCGTSLRAPLCRSDELSLPPGAVGYYHFVSSTNAVATSGSVTQVQETYFRLAETHEGITLSATADINVQTGRQRRTLSSLANDSVPVLMLSVCKIGGIYYSQNRNGDGTFSVARMDSSASGITMIGLAFEPESLDKHHFGTFFVPRFDKVKDDNKWEFDSQTPTRFIVDNRDLSDSRREELMALAKPTAMGVVLSRAAQLSTTPETIKLSLTASGSKRGIH